MRLADTLVDAVDPRPPEPPPRVDHHKGYVEEIVELALAGGWYVVELRLERPQRIVLADLAGVRLTIEDELGLYSKWYLEHIEARLHRNGPREPDPMDDFDPRKPGPGY